MDQKPINWEACERKLAEIYADVKEPLIEKLNAIYRDGDLRVELERFPPHISISFCNAQVTKQLEFNKHTSALADEIAAIADTHQLRAENGYYRSTRIKIGDRKKVVREFVRDYPYSYVLKPNYRDFTLQG